MLSRPSARSLVPEATAAAPWPRLEPDAVALVRSDAPEASFFVPTASWPSLAVAAEAPFSHWRAPLPQPAAPVA